MQLHAACQFAGTPRHLRLQRGAQCLSQSLHAKFIPHGAGGSDPQLLYAMRPVELIVVVGNNHLRPAGACAGGRGARTAVMDDRSQAREELPVIHIADAP